MAGFLESLIGTESGGNWQAQNSVKGAGGMMGHFGRLQFGRARLQDAMNAGVIPQGVTPEQFMADPAMQQRVEAWHFSDIDRNAANMGLTKYVGQTIGGIPITPEAIRAMAHLGGIGGAAKFLETGGQHNPADAYGTSLADYARKHGGAMGGGDMRGSGGNPLVMGGAGGDTMQPEKPKGLLGFLGDEDKRARLAMALEGMTLNPNQGYMMMLSDGIKDRRTTKAADAAKNKTAAWLRSQGREDLAAAIESGVMNGTDAAKMAMDKPDPLAQINLELKQLELQQARNPTPDPMVALEIEKRQLELEKLRNPVVEPSSSLGKLEADYRAGLISEEMYKAEMASMAPQGSVIESDGQGGFRMVTGAGVGTSAKPFTEGQSKDNVFATRAEGALDKLDPIADALTGLGNNALDYDPTGVLRGAFQSDSYQTARQAGDEFLQAILRKDTGAAITPAEQQLYGKTYLPGLGDNAAVIEQKKVSRRRAIEALKSGMSQTQLDAVAKADAAVIEGIKSGNTTTPTSGHATITSDAEYNALPSGTTFVGPDGKTRRKP